MSVPMIVMAVTTGFKLFCIRAGQMLGFVCRRCRLEVMVLISTIKQLECCMPGKTRPENDLGSRWFCRIQTCVEIIYQGKLPLKMLMHIECFHRLSFANFVFLCNRSNRKNLCCSRGNEGLDLSRLFTFTCVSCGGCLAKCCQELASSDKIFNTFEILKHKLVQTLFRREAE
jgi:hypothetical protein